MGNALRTALDGLDKDLKQAAELRVRIGDAKLRKFQDDLVFELAFLRSVIAWETFLEESFFLFATGRPSLSGVPPRRLVTPKYRADAEAMVLGGRSFVSWTSADTLIRSKLWFDAGGPFVPLGSDSRLDELQTVRNRIAHGIGNAQTKFTKLCEVRHPNSNVRRGMGPGRFLSHPAAKRATDTRFERYQGVLLSTATAICQ